MDFHTSSTHRCTIGFASTKRYNLWLLLPNHEKRRSKSYAAQFEELSNTLHQLDEASGLEGEKSYSHFFARLRKGES